MPTVLVNWCTEGRIGPVSEGRRRPGAQGPRPARTRDRPAHPAALRPGFFQRLWGEAKFDPSQVRSVADITRIPQYTVDDIRRSIDDLFEVVEKQHKLAPAEARAALAERVARMERRTIPLLDRLGIR